MAGELFRATAQVGLETTYGTPVAATRIVYLNDQPVLTRDREARSRQFATGTRDNQRAATLGPSVVGGTVAMPLSADEIIEWLLCTLQGNVSPTTPTGATNGRLWTFGAGGTTIDSMTLQYNDGATAYHGYGVYGNSVTIEGNANAEAMASFELFGVERAANALTGSLTHRTPTYFEGYETLVYLDSHQGTPGASQIPAFLVGWSITFTNNLQRKYLAENRNRMKRAVLSPIGVTASLTIEAASAQAATELANWDSVTKRLLTLRFGGNDAITGETPVAEIQTVEITGSPTGGNFQLRVLGQTTGNIAYDADAAAVQSALNTALAALGSDYTVAVTGSNPGPFDVTFNGAGFGSENVPIMVLSTNGLTGGSSPTVVIAQDTPGYSGKRTVWLDLPAYWSAADTGGTDAGTRTYNMSMDYIYDPTNAFGFRMRVLNGRASAWS